MKLKTPLLILFFSISVSLFAIDRSTVKPLLASVTQGNKELRIYYHGQEWVARLYNKKAPIYTDNYNKIKSLLLGYKDLKIVYEKNYKIYNLVIDLNFISAAMETEKEVFIYVN